MKLIAALIAIFVSLPIWFYLLYSILVRVNASELMFFLFWVYVPATMFVSFISRLNGED